VTDPSNPALVAAAVTESGRTATYRLDDYWNTLTITDPLQNETTLVYDELGRLTQETNALDQSRYYRYDAVGNLRHYTDRDGRVTHYSYDALDRLIEEQCSGEDPITFQYDLSGTLHSASNDAATYTYAYDALGRRTDTAAEIDGLLPTVNLHEEYNRWNVRTSLSATITQVGVPAVADFQTVYSYHGALGYLESIEQKGQDATFSNPVIDKKVTFHNDILGRWDTMTSEVLDSDSPYANATGWVEAAYTARDFDHAGRVSEIRNCQGSVSDGQFTLIQGQTLAYTYDQAGRVTHTTASGGITFSYDAASQLSGVDYTGNSAVYEDAALDYDLAGNRDTRDATIYTGSPPTPSVTSYDYQVSADNRLASDGTYTYQYDAEGHRTARTNIATGATTRDTWDHRGRLVKVSQYADANPASTPTQEVENFYDAFDRRVGKKLSRSGQTDRYERCVYDGSDMVLAFEGTSAGLSNADLKHRYLWGEAVDQLLADENLELGLCYFPQADLQGSIVGSGGYAPAANQFGGYNGVEYDPFGNAVGQIYSDTRFRYTGQEWDADAGLYYYNARWYDPHTGQFLSQDPLGFAAGDPNLYRYVGNNVTNWTDPSGQIWGLVAGAFVGAMNTAVYVGTSLYHGQGPTWGGAAGAFTNGMVAGLVAGALTGDATSLIGAAAVGMVAGTAGGMAGSVVQQGIDSYRRTGHVSISSHQVAYAGMTGGLGGAAGGALGYTVGSVAGGGGARLAFAGVPADSAVVVTQSLAAQRAAAIGATIGASGAVLVTDNACVPHTYYAEMSSQGPLDEPIESHHELPNKFKPNFKRAGLNIEDFKVPLERARHRLKPTGLHTGADNWNAQWARFFDVNKEATKEEILEQLAKMRTAFGLE
jgi:RHS repeat-associated protein